MHINITESYLAQYGGVAAGRPDLHPVTGAQRRFLTMRRLAVGTAPIVVPLYFEFPRGTVDPARLEEAAACLAARHPALRMRFDTDAPVPVQRLAEPEGHVRRLAARAGESTADALRRALLAWVTEGPVLRLLLATSDDRPDHETLAVVVDHAACDEQSLGLITDGLTRAYRDRTSAREARADAGRRAVEEYRDAVERQLAAERAASEPRDLDYWAGRFADPGPTVPAGPPEGARPTGASRPAAPVPAETIDDPTGMVKHRRPLPADGARTGLFPALLSAVAAAVAPLPSSVAKRQGRAPLIGYPWGGRPLGAAPVLGCFLNTVLFTTAAPGDLDEACDRWWDDIDHADTPVDEVVRAARSGGSRWSGTVDALLTLEDTTRRPPLELGGVEGVETHLRGPALQSPVAVSVSQSRRELLVRMGWNRHQLDDREARWAFDTLCTTLDGHLGPTPDRTDPTASLR
ncbi:condensation domain-containing protein [Streptomyces shenzhenensis]|uniref:condensation domain-containing protein n=2 Tax=Streptomyces shenzhenensis TaxID=943815 RepID=UPI0038299E9E